MTGTPVQNKLGDLGSLLHFLRIDPYSKATEFEADISTVWKKGKPKEALERLKRLMQCLLLRRAKSTINIPPRTDLVCALEFRPEERKLYDTVHQAAVQRVQEAILQVTGSSSYLNALQQIDALRRICNVGCLYIPASDPSRKVNPSLEQGLGAEEPLGYLLKLEDAIYRFCDTPIEVVPEIFTQMMASKCNRTICSTCKLELTMVEIMECRYNPICEVAGIEPYDNANGLPGQAEVHRLQPLPTKIEALLSQLKDIPPNTKR